MKVTGWSRIAYFDRVYPDARFVSLRRDPRSVASSWVRPDGSTSRALPTVDGWQWGEVRPDYLERLWRELGGGPLLSVALKIHLDLEDIALEHVEAPHRCHELWYEDLISEPEATLRGICDFAGLDWTPAFQRHLDHIEFFDSTEKWRRHLTDEQGGLVLDFLDAAAGLAKTPTGPVRPPG